MHRRQAPVCSESAADDNRIKCNRRIVSNVFLSRWDGLPPPKRPLVIQPKSTNCIIVASFSTEARQFNDRLTGHWRGTVGVVMHLGDKHRPWLNPNPGARWEWVRAHTWNPESHLLGSSRPVHKPSASQSANGCGSSVARVTRPFFGVVKSLVLFHLVGPNNKNNHVVHNRALVGCDADSGYESCFRRWPRKELTSVIIRRNWEYRVPEV